MPGRGRLGLFSGALASMRGIYFLQQNGSCFWRAGKHARGQLPDNVMYPEITHVYIPIKSNYKQPDNPKT